MRLRGDRVGRAELVHSLCIHISGLTYRYREQLSGRASNTRAEPKLVFQHLTGVLNSFQAIAVVYLLSMILLSNEGYSMGFNATLQETHKNFPEIISTQGIPISFSK